MEFYNKRLDRAFQASRFRENHDLEDAETMLEMIDKVDPALVGCAHTHTLLDASYAPFRPYLQFFVRDDDRPRKKLFGWSEPWRVASNEVIAERLTRRSFPTRTTAKNCICDALDGLCKVQYGGLFDKVTDVAAPKLADTLADDGRRSRRAAEYRAWCEAGEKTLDVEFDEMGYITAYANFFTVPKGDNKLRTIIDGRLGNMFIDSSRYPFVMFGLDTLINVVNRVRDAAEDKHDRKMYFVLGDQRHWFWQLYMPERYRYAFGINHASGRAYYLPKSWPMGCTLSPVLAQSVTLAALLATDPPAGAAPIDPDARLPSSFDVDYDFLDYYRNAAAKDRPSLPPWIPFKHGGGIFVIMDNFFIVTPSKAVYNKWKNRVDTVTQRFHIQLKLQNYNVPAPEKGPAAYKTLEAQEVQCYEIDANTPPECWPVFLGIAFGYGKRYIAVDKDEPHEICLEDIATHRDLASVLGKLLWYLRVYSVDLCDPEPQQLLEIYRKSFPRPRATAATTSSSSSASASAESKEDDDPWDRLLPAGLLYARDYKHMQILWRRRREKRCAESPRFQLGAGIAFVAVDASKQNDSTDADGGTIGVWYRPSLEADSDRTSSAPTQGFKGVSLPHHRRIIAVAELQAIVEGVALVLQNTSPETRPGLIVMGSDNMNAIAWVEKMFARNEDANQLLCSLKETLGSCTRLFVTYIPSEENVADAPSRRQTEVDPRDLRAVQTMNRLLAAERESRHVWNLAGLTGRVHAREADSKTTEIPEKRKPM